MDARIRLSLNTPVILPACCAWRGPHTIQTQSSLRALSAVTPIVVFVMVVVVVVNCASHRWQPDMAVSAHGRHPLDTVCVHPAMRLLAHDKTAPKGD